MAIYKSPHKLDSLTEEDYRQVQPAIGSADVFARMITPCVYVADLARDNFLYVSDCLLKHFRCTRDEVMPLGYRMFEKYFVKEADVRLLRKLDTAIHAAYWQEHSDLADEVFSVDVNMSLGRNEVMIHYKVSVLATDCDGFPWLLLGMVSRSAMRFGGHIIVGNAKSHERHRFVDDDGPGHWEAMPHNHLSDLELEMLSLSSRGYSVDEIARMLHRSPDTVRYYRKQVFARLGVDNVAHALAVADELCLI